MTKLRVNTSFALVYMYNEGNEKENARLAVLACAKRENAERESRGRNIGAVKLITGSWLVGWFTSAHA